MAARSSRRPRPRKAPPARRAAAHRFGTLAVHAGEPFRPDEGLFTIPIIQQSTFAFRNTRHLVESFAGKGKTPVYTRWGNPTADMVERKIAALEGAEKCLLFGSGMAAITTALLTLAGRGDHVVSARAVYGGAYEFLSQLAPRLGVDVTFVDGTDLEEIRRSVRPETRAIWIESPVNPTLRVLDLKSIARLGARAGVPVLLDGTFASPVNQQPIALGISAVVHSATKYLGGHSDLIAGAVSGPRGLMKRMWGTRKLLGGVVDPHQAWLLGRGLRTLEIRVLRQNALADRVARFLSRHPRVRHVHYPGLSSHPDHALARKQMTGFGGMVTFEVRGGLKSAIRVADRLRMIRIGGSLGGLESICCHPRLTSHMHVPADVRRRAGIADGMIRLSCGIEDAEDIIADLEQALRRG
jgi:methionine-gamma-lyase